MQRNRRFAALRAVKGQELGDVEIGQHVTVDHQEGLVDARLLAA
jgi:hypothetical protein